MFHSIIHETEKYWNGFLASIELEKKGFQSKESFTLELKFVDLFWSHFHTMSVQEFTEWEEESRHAIKIANKERPMTKKKHSWRIITFHNFYWLVTLYVNTRHEMLREIFEDKRRRFFWSTFVMFWSGLLNLKCVSRILWLIKGIFECF